MLLLFDDSFSNKPVSRDLKEVSGLICLLFGGIYYRLYITDKLSIISVDIVVFLQLGFHFAKLRILLEIRAINQRTDNHQREKQHGSETKAEAQTSATTDSQNKADVAADTKTKDKTKTEETKKPTPGFWGWGYYGALAAVCVVLFFYFRRHWRKK